MTGNQIKSAARTLVVDDMPSMRQLVKACLTQLGLPEPLEATNGKSAWPLLQGRRFDLIVCDLDMPVMDGMELLQAVRADPRLNPTQFLMLTANAKANIVKEAIAAGVDDYVVKPFTPLAMQAKVARLLPDKPR